MNWTEPDAWECNGCEKIEQGSIDTDGGAILPSGWRHTVVDETDDVYACSAACQLLIGAKFAKGKKREAE